MKGNYDKKKNDRKKKKTIILCGNYKRTYRLFFDLRIMIDLYIFVYVVAKIQTYNQNLTNC